MSILSGLQSAKDMATQGIDSAVGMVKEFGSELEPGRSPLSNLAADKHGYTSVEFPQDVQGPGQRHFIRFNIVTVDGTTFESDQKSSEVADESTTGDFLGGLAGGAIDDALGGGALGALAGGVAGQIAGNISDQIGLSGAVDTAVGAVRGAADEVIGNVMGAAEDLASEAMGAAEGLLSEVAGGISGLVPDSVESTFGKLNVDAGMIKDAVVEKVPIAKDALNVGSFLGSIGDGFPQEFSSVVGGNKKSEGDIILYMPFSVNETYQANWQGGDMGFVGAVMKAMESGAANALEQVKMGDVAGELTQRLAKIGGAVIGNENLAKYAGKAQDRVVNPYFELFFESVSPRTFTFDFKMSPRNPSEAEAIQLIVKLFKLYSAPVTTPRGKDSLRFWGYPAMFEIEYWNADNVHRIKRCALQNITVNYSGDGTNHTFYDGRPMQTDLTLTFMESELMTRDEFRAGY